MVLDRIIIKEDASELSLHMKMPERKIYLRCIINKSDDKPAMYFSCLLNRDMCINIINTLITWHDVYSHELYPIRDTIKRHKQV
jgi:hypothetical protein